MPAQKDSYNTACCQDMLAQKGLAGIFKGVAELLCCLQGERPRCSLAAQWPFGQHFCSPAQSMYPTSNKHPFLSHAGKIY